MKCKKHGEIGDMTIKFIIPIQPIGVRKNGEEVELKPYDRGGEFCLECLVNFLKKKIGIVKEK